jgi:hypothetical protein
LRFFLRWLVAGLGASLRGDGEVLSGIGVIERSQQCGAAPVGAQRVGDGGAVIERGADVDFQSLELPDEGGLVNTEVAGSSVDGGERHDRLEAVKSLPAMQSTLDRAADVAMQRGREPGDHLGVTGDSRRAGGDAVLGGAADDGHVGDSAFVGNVGEGPAFDEVLLAQPLLVQDDATLAGAEQIADLCGDFPDDVTANAGLVSDLVQGLAR